MVSKIGHRQREEAFLLKSVNYSDHHRILSVFTRNHGRLDLIALGAQKSKRRFSGVLDYLNHLQMEFHQPGRGSLLQLDGVELLEGHEAIRRDWDRVQTALSWLKLLQEVLRPQGALPGLFQCLQDGFRGLSQGGGAWEDLVFRREALAHLGYRLQLEFCTNCGATGGTWAQFFPEEGGMLCQNCRGPASSPIRAAFFPRGDWSFSSPAPAWLEERGAQARKILDQAFQSYFVA